MSVEPEVSVIIVSYNTRAMTLDCLRAVRDDIGTMPAEVWVVDNASQDDTVAAIRAAFPEVQVIANRRNVGFGTANNQAMQRARGRYFLLINSDAFPQPGATQALIRYLQAHPTVGLVGPRLLHADGSLQYSCFRRPSPIRAWLEYLWIEDLLHRHPVVGSYRYWPHNGDRLVEFVSGACMLMRREVFLQLGGFDESFFMYAEETDLQRRMWQAGWCIAFTASAEVIHFIGASNAGEMERQALCCAGLDRYYCKHYGLRGVLAMRCAMLIGCSLRALLWLGVMVGFPQRRAMARAKVRLMTWLVVRQATVWRLPIAEYRAAR